MQNVSLWQMVALIGTGFVFGFVAAILLCREEMLAKAQLKNDELGLKVEQEIAKRIQQENN